ncbi:hypothetical protein EJ06DRAFT_78146 [Trichodelitschia bisporula]|uniref:Uncharacterized protein n=1 Tax=Trichodelitschia bisporula TaxID=703511 RepID=A0A6G1HT66_9PEZI|nr:hypothetical protein EJ06DRAFT_78146 [Trichodelitschia bisporula]
MSAGKFPADKSKAARLPAPTLFVGPASRNASNISLQPATTTTTKEASLRPTASREHSQIPEWTKDARRPDTATSLSDAASLARQPSRPQTQQQHERTDALWAAMQTNLEEVELSAASGMHVFGPEHSKALEELRTAQIALAQAWARIEVEDESQEPGKEASAKGKETVGKVKSVETSMEGEKAEVKGRPRAGTGASAGSNKTELEEGTENDIAMARKRREANDRYFQRVNHGVLDVVQKLEEVANAMKGVELKSKQIWGEQDGADDAGGLSMN